LILVGTTNIYGYKNNKLSTIEKGTITIADIAANPVKNELLVGYANGDVGVIDLNSGNKNVFFSNPGNSNYKLTFNDDGTRLALVGNALIIRLYNTSNLSSPINTFSGHTGQVWDLQFSHDGKQLASGSFDKSVRLWDLQNPGNPPIVLDDHRDKVGCITYSSDDKYVFAGVNDNTINLKKWPTNADLFDSTICTLVTRNLTRDEWETFVATDIPYQKTCPSITK
jgi:WD40 repeat protein